MKTKFLASVAHTSEDMTPAMPWERGARRAAFIAKRRAMEEFRQSA